MSSKKKKALNEDVDLIQDDAFDAIMALSSASSSATTSGTTCDVSITSNSQTSSSSKGSRRKSSGNLEINGKNAKAAEREAKRQRKEEEKQKKEEEKAAKAVAAENNKIYKPGECMKYMKIEVHPSLSSVWYMADLPREASQAGCRICPAIDICDGYLLMWSRTVPATITDQLGLKTKERCDRALYIQDAEAAAERVAKRELAQHVAWVRDMSACHVTLAIFGTKDYFKTSNRKTKNSSQKLMDEIVLEMAITDVLVTAGCDTVLVDTPNDLALLIIQFTKAIAEAPHKQSKRSLDEQAEFYMRGDNKKCVRVDPNGNGLSGLWQQMVAMLPNSSLETARAVCAQYTSPLELYESLQGPEGVTSLAEVPIARSAAASARARRLGPEFARKMNTLLTARDGNILIE